jgi:hypothetical protein
MRWLRGFAAFLFDFVIGDDWTVAAAVVVALAVTWAVADWWGGSGTWVVLVAAVAIVLPASLARAVRRRS